MAGTGAPLFRDPVRAGPANPFAAPLTRQVFDYLGGLGYRGPGRTVSGQLAGAGDEVLFADAADSPLFQAFEQSGRWVGMMAVRYDRGDKETRKRFEYQAVNPALMDYWRQGGLVAVGVTFNNPYDPDAGPHAAVEDLAPLRMGAGGIHANPYRAQLYSEYDAVAEGLAELRDAGVVVVFTPLHEFNGGWFWYGTHDEMPPEEKTRRQNQYKAIYCELFDYFTNVKGLDNLLWGFAGSATEEDLAALWYPGSDCVDVVALNFYIDPASPDIRGVRNYESLEALGTLPFDGRIPAFNETGAPRAISNLWPDVRYDYLGHARGIQRNFPEVAYVIAWNNRWAYAANDNASGLLNSSFMANRADLSHRVRDGQRIGLSSSAGAVSVAADSTLHLAPEAAALDQDFLAIEVAPGRYALRSAANQLLWRASGGGGVLRADGTSLADPAAAFEMVYLGHARFALRSLLAQPGGGFVVSTGATNPLQAIGTTAASALAVSVRVLNRLHPGDVVSLGHDGSAARLQVNGGVARVEASQVSGPRRLFTVTDLGGGTLGFRSTLTGMHLRVTDWGDGRPFRLKADGTWITDYCRFLPEYQGGGLYALRSMHSGRYLDLSAIGPAYADVPFPGEATAVHVQHRGDLPAGDPVLLHNARTGQFLEVQGPSTVKATGTSVTGTPFVLEPFGQGHLRLEDALTGKGLRVSASAPLDFRVQVEQAGPLGNAAAFRVSSFGDSAFGFVSALSGRAVYATRDEAALQANAAIAAPYLTDLADGERVALESTGRLLTLVTDVSARLVAGDVGPDSTFIVGRSKHNKLTLQLAAQDGYLMGSDWQDGRLKLSAALGISARVEFWLEQVPGRGLALRLAHNDRFVIRGSDGRLYARGDAGEEAMVFSVRRVSGSVPIRSIPAGSENEAEVRFHAIPAP